MQQKRGRDETKRHGLRCVQKEMVVANLEDGCAVTPPRREQSRCVGDGRGGRESDQQGRWDELGFGVADGMRLRLMRRQRQIAVGGGGGCGGVEKKWAKKAEMRS